jgi:hypothetical protein
VLAGPDLGERAAVVSYRDAFGGHGARQVGRLDEWLRLRRARHQVQRPRTVVTPTAMHELGAAQETLTNGLDRSSTFQLQPMMSEPTAVQLVGLGHDTLSRVLLRRCWATARPAMLFRPPLDERQLRAAGRPVVLADCRAVRGGGTRHTVQEVEVLHTGPRHWRAGRR